MENIKKEHNAQTGEINIVELTELEIKQNEIDGQKMQEMQDRLRIEKELKSEAKAEAQAKLAALGLTVEDLQALGL